VQIQPDFAAAHNNLGLILGNEGDLKTAIYHFEQALRFHPDYAPAQQNLESALRAQQKELP
jgi:tetratricopeptide (TPR) repeat protein